MKALSLFIIMALPLALTQVKANEALPYGLQCASTSSADLKTCLKKESGKIDEANLPNEVILSTEASGKEALLALVNAFLVDRQADQYALEISAKLPLIEESVATALIIQYEDEPQLYYYVIDKNGKLEVVFDGLNSVDISETFNEIFTNDPEVFSLKSPNVSDNFKEWMKHLKESN